MSWLRLAEKPKPMFMSIKVQSLFTESDVTWKIGLREIVLDKAVARLHLGALGERLWAPISRGLQTVKHTSFCVMKTSFLRI